MKRRTKQKLLRGSKGAVSVFLIIVLVPMMTISCLFVDMSRVRLAKSVVHSAGDLAMNTVLTQYDTMLEQYYGLFATSQSLDSTISDMREYFERCIVSAGISEKDAQMYVSSMWGSTDDTPIMDMLDIAIAEGDNGFNMAKRSGASLCNPILLKGQIVNFMKYRAPINTGLSLLASLKSFANLDKETECIVHVLSYFEANNTAYIVMEFLNGCTLGEYVQQNGLKTWEESVDIVLQICDALKEIHKVGIIHRDISPDNIFMCENGAVKLIDFGAARFAQNMESNYTVILKPGFAPPEQYTQISEQGPWTDVYAVGATLYYLVTGQKPEESTNRKTNDTLQEPITINTVLPQYLSDAIMKAMAIEPHLRFASIDELVAVIKKEKKVVSLNTEKRRRWVKRFIGIAALLVVLVFVGGSLVTDIIQKHKKTVLNDATFEVWYVENDTKSLKGTYAEIIKSFCDEYDNISIHARGFISEAELSAALPNGSPSLVQIDVEVAKSIPDRLNLKQIADEEKTNIFEVVSSVFKKNGGNECFFLKDYAKHFTDQTCVPTGFTVPVLYVNTSMVQFDADQISGFSDLKSFVEEGSIVMVDERLTALYAQLLDIKQKDVLISGTVDAFVKGDSVFFLSDTSAFFKVREMPKKKTGVPKVVAIQANELPCEWNILWSVIKRSKNQDAAAERFLSFLLSETVQTNLFGKKDSGNALPLNGKALETFCDLYDDLSFIPSITKHCVFGEMR